MNEWISTKDRLPRNGTEVLICWLNHARLKIISIGEIYKTSSTEWHFVYCDVDGTNGLDESQVTHWMPLPPKPKKK